MNFCVEIFLLCFGVTSWRTSLLCIVGELAGEGLTVHQSMGAYRHWHHRVGFKGFKDLRGHPRVIKEQRTSLKSSMRFIKGPLYTPDPEI